ncbi:MAG: hypothetical protein O7F12_16435 [Nitrospirae bacterium]|nr:hypothetical protein [Nitrospirota bacterium]
MLLIALTGSLVGCDPEDQINQYFAYLGLTRLAVPRTDIDPGTLIVTKGKEAFFADHMLDYVDQDSGAKQDYGIFGGDKIKEYQAMLRQYQGNTALSAQTALQFVQGVFQLSPGVELGLTGQVRIEMVDAKFRKMKVSAIQKFLNRKESRGFRKAVHQHLKQGHQAFVAFEVYRTKSLKIVSEAGQELAPSLKVGTLSPLPIKGEGSLSYKKTSKNEVVLSRNRYYAFAVRTARLIQGRGKLGLTIDRTGFAKPADWGIKSAGTDDQYSAPLGESYTPLTLQ